MSSQSSPIKQAHNSIRFQQTRTWKMYQTLWHCIFNQLNQQLKPKELYSCSYSESTLSWLYVTRKTAIVCLLLIASCWNSNIQTFKTLLFDQVSVLSSHNKYDNQMVYQFQLKVPFFSIWAFGSSFVSLFVAGIKLRSSYT